jgi:PAS domain S-box-containing protein
MAGVAVAVGGLSVGALYQAGFDQQRKRLVEIAKSQARLMEAVARFDALHSQRDHVEGAEAATLSQVIEAHQNYGGLGQSGEFTLARRNQERIEFLLNRRHDDLDGPKATHWKSNLAEPMRRALKGQSGSMIGRDYRGVRVLAAYEPVAVLNLGIVAKIDMSEIRAPFVKAGVLSGAGALAIFLLGALLFRVTAAPIIERKLAEEALQDSEARFRDFAETASDWLWEMDENLRFTYFSDRFAQLGLSVDERIGKTRVQASGDDTSQPKWQAHLADLEARRPFRDFVHEAHTPDGRLIHTSVNGMPIFDEAGNFRGYRGTGTDITERQRAEEGLLASEQALQQRIADLEEAQHKLEMQGESLVRLADDLLIARDEARAADRAKSGFLANMSHELRTPLNAIIGFSDIIKDERLGPVGSTRYREYADDINESGQHLLALINNILDLSKVESGTDELHEENIEILEIANSVMKLVTGLARSGNVELELDMPDDIPMLHADERKVTQILLNLLSNAIKFTPGGGKVALKIWSRAESGYVFQIIDTGIGITFEDIPKALTRFQQIDSGLNRIHEGTGLGLPLTKLLVEMHGGYLDLQSEDGVGTTVTVRFPAERVKSSPRSPKASDTADRKAG